MELLLGSSSCLLVPYMTLAMAECVSKGVIWYKPHVVSGLIESETLVGASIDRKRDPLAPLKGLRHHLRDGILPAKDVLLFKFLTPYSDSPQIPTGMEL